MEKEIIKIIKALRESKGMNQSHVADSLDMSITSYSKIERGDTKLTISHIEGIAKALGVSPYYIFSGNSDNTDIEALKRENEALKKDIERYKGVVDALTDLINAYKKHKDELPERSKEEKEEIKAKSEELMKGFKFEP